MTTTATGCRSSTCPPWLQAALAEIELRVKELSAASPSPEPDSFAERAENYYQKRPQLITLLHDLHNRYLYLADRYTQALKPHHRRQPSAASSDGSAITEHTLESAASDAESSISFQSLATTTTEAGLDKLLVEIVMTRVEKDILTDEMQETDRWSSESARKIELQRSLLELLESERMVLLGENARMGFRAAAAEEEARAMAAGAAYMRRKAVELERMVIKMREDHRVCLLGRKIEGLQGQIYGLERRNRECYEAMLRREAEKGEVRAELERLRGENQRLRETVTGRREGVARWWQKLRRIEWAPCGPHLEVRKGCF